MRALAAAAAFGIMLVLASAAVARQKSIRQENAATRLLQQIASGQERFKASQAGYAADLTTLVTRCPDGRGPALPITLEAPGYVLTLRPADHASEGPPDCHGVATVSEFIASARPEVPGADGSRGMTITSAGRVYVYFDGVPPRERDIAPGGTAAALDDLPDVP